MPDEPAPAGGSASSTDGGESSRGRLDISSILPDLPTRPRLPELASKLPDLPAKLTELPSKLPDLPTKRTETPRERPVRQQGRDKEKDQPREPGNMLSYVRETLDTFAERPLGPVDSLVFSWIAYYRLNKELAGAATWEGIGLHELMRAEDFEAMFGTSWDPDSSRDLLFAVCASPRFRTVRVCKWAFITDSEQEEQFAAMTFRLPTGEAYVAFRGTDSTIVGWKEDLNMAYLCPVPSQEDAEHYLIDILGCFDGPVYVGGHSKGGNLAVYAAVMCPDELRPRIAHVYSHDGPGFNERFAERPAWRALEGRITKTIPKSSVIGLIMDDGSTSTVVESDGLTIYQHNPFLWEVEDGAFVPADGLTVSARYLATTIADWMERFTPEERGRFIDTLFDVIGVTGARRFADIKDTWKTSLPAIRAAADELDPEERDIVLEVLKVLAKTATVDKVFDAAANKLLTSLWSLRDCDEEDAEDERPEEGVEPVEAPEGNR